MADDNSPELEDQEQYEDYPDDYQPQDSLTDSQKLNYAADMLLAKNAPKGSLFRSFQSRLRLGRSKSSQFRQNPLKALKGITPEQQLQRDAGVVNRYHATNKNLATKLNLGDEKGFLKSDDFQKIDEHVKNLSIPEKQKYARLRDNYNQALQRDIEREKLGQQTSGQYHLDKAQKPPSSVAPETAEVSSQAGAEATSLGAQAGESAVLSGTGEAAALGEAGAVAGAADAAGVTAAANAGWTKSVGAQIAAGRAKAAAMRKAALAAARKGAANMAARRGVVGATGKLATTLLSEAAVPVIGWIIGIATALWVVLKTKVGKYILYGLAGVVLLPAIFFFIVVGSIGLSILPNTAADKDAVTLGSTFAGSRAAKAELTADLIKKEKDRLAVFQAQVDRTNPSQSASVKSQIAAINLLMDSILKEPDQKKRAKTTQDIIAKERALGQSLPIGDWIVTLAENYVGTTTTTGSNGENSFRCSVARRSCASFVSTVLQETGVLGDFESNTTGVWNNRDGRVIIERGGTFDVSKLQPGDVLFFGTGSSATYKGALFNHVGFFIGTCQKPENKGRNDCIVDASSSKKKVMERPVTIHGPNDGNPFMGAKRFGK